MPRLLDRDFDYVHSSKTDIRKTFERLSPGWNRKRKKPKRAQVQNVVRLATKARP